MSRWLAVTFITLLFASFLTAPDARADVPTHVRAQYKIIKAGITIGNVEEVFTRTGEEYKITSITQTSGPLAWILRDRLTITSAGRIGSSGIEPALYEFKRQRDSRKNLSSRFDWEKGKILCDHEGQIEPFDLPRGTLDRVSAMYQFMFNAPRTAEVLVRMSQGKQSEQYRYVKQGEPSVKIGDSEYATVHYVRDAKPGESRAELWLAKDRHYLPVRMVFEDSHGISLEQSLVTLDIE